MADDTCSRQCAAYADHLIKAADAFFHRSWRRQETRMRGGDIHLSAQLMCFPLRPSRRPRAQSDDEAHGAALCFRCSWPKAAARKADEASAAA